MYSRRVMPSTMKQSSCILSANIAGFPVFDGDWQYILNASVGFRQIIHTKHAEILYTNIRKWPKQH